MIKTHWNTLCPSFYPIPGNKWPTFRRYSDSTFALSTSEQFWAMRKNLFRPSCSFSLLFYGTKAETAQVMQSFTLCLLKVKGVVAHWSTEHKETEVLWITPFHLYIICKLRVFRRSHVRQLIYLIQMKAAVFTNHPHCKTHYLRLMSLTSKSRDEMTQLARKEF